MIKNLRNKYSALPKVVKATLWFSLITFLQKGFSALTTPIFTRLMSTEQYGMYSLYISWYDIISIVCTFNITAGVFNSLMVEEQEKKEKIASAVIGFEFFTTILSSLIYILMFFIFGEIGGLTFELWLMIFIEVFFNIPILVWVATQKFYINYLKCFFVIVSELVISALLSIFLVLVSDYKVEFRVLGTIITYFIFGLVLLIITFKKDKTFYDRTIWRKLLVFGGPLVFHFLFEALLSHSDRLFIKNILGDTQTAIYSLAHQLSWILYIIITALNSSIIPWMYKKMKNEDYTNISNVFIMGMLFLSGLIFVVSLLSPELLKIYGGDKYVEGKYLVPILSSCILVEYVYGIFVKIELFYQKNKTTIIATTLGGITNVILNIIFINYWGIVGAAIATLISYIVICFFHYSSLKIILNNKNIALITLINDKLIIILMFVFIILNIISCMLFNLLIIRIIIILIIASLYIVFSKKIYKFLTLRGR